MALLRWLRSCRRPFQEHIMLLFVLACLIRLVIMNSSHEAITALPDEEQIEDTLIRDPLKENSRRHVQDSPRTEAKKGQKVNVTHSHKIFRNKLSDKLYAKDKTKYPEYLKGLGLKKKVQCNGKFVGFSDLTAMLHDVVINRDQCSGPKGGENFHQLMNQSEDMEFLTYKHGFLTMDCNSRVSYKFKGQSKNHLNSWMDVLTQGPVENVDEVVDDLTIAITRYGYVNMYHTITDYYNAFLLMAFFNKTQHQTNILILDAHPAGGLDIVWSTVFNTMARVSQLPRKTRFSNLAFGIPMFNSPMDVSDFVTPRLPLGEEFREFFLTNYNLPNFYPLRCDRLSVLIVWRRNYVAHPRNPTGKVRRKIRNENELVEAIETAYPNAIVRGQQMDQFEVADQVKMFAESDILIGMHGAALTGMVFMHEGRGLIELFPKYVSPFYGTHYVQLANQKKIFYESWVNINPFFEYHDYYTKVPPKEIISRIRLVKEKMCPTKNR